MVIALGLPWFSPDCFRSSTFRDLLWRKWKREYLNLALKYEVVDRRLGHSQMLDAILERGFKFLNVRISRLFYDLEYPWDLSEYI